MQDITIFMEKENVIFFLKHIDRDKIAQQLRDFCAEYHYEGFFNLDYDPNTPLEGNINSGNLSIRFFFRTFTKENISEEYIKTFILTWGEIPKFEMLIYGSRQTDEHILIVNLVKFLQPIYKNMAFEQIENVIWFDQDLLCFYPD